MAHDYGSSELPGHLLHISKIVSGVKHSASTFALISSPSSEIDWFRTYGELVNFGTVLILFWNISIKETLRFKESEYIRKHMKVNKLDTLCGARIGSLLNCWRSIYLLISQYFIKQNKASEWKKLLEIILLGVSYEYTIICAFEGVRIRLVQYLGCLNFD